MLVASTIDQLGKNVAAVRVNREHCNSKEFTSIEKQNLIVFYSSFQLSPPAGSLTRSCREELLGGIDQDVHTDLT